MTFAAAKNAFHTRPSLPLSLVASAVLIAATAGPSFCIPKASWIGGQRSTRSDVARLPEVNGDFFGREVLPILKKSCLGCHGVGEKFSKLDLRSRATAIKGGTHGTAIVPGSADKSRLFQLVSGKLTPLMPPAGKLSEREIDVLRRWIDGGAPWPGGAIDTANKQVWWSFAPPRMPAVPKSPAKWAAWVRNPIDSFVLQRLVANGLTPSSRAPRRVLIRRAYLDLVGLPPSPEEVRAFESDADPRAWEKVVDRLLASPHYGERWGRHWLDLVRYADSGGFEGDKDRPLAYRYRDYVIRAFNEDKPYDRFVREQIAGDELPQVTPDSIVATGYLAAGPQDIVMQNAKNRADELDDLVSTTGSVFLGLTVACARCHDHKYDPVKQTDYYRLSAIFAPTERREIEVASPEERHIAALRNSVLDREAAPILVKLNPLREKARSLAKPITGTELSDAALETSLPEADKKPFRELADQIKAIDARRPQLPKAYAVTDKNRKWPAHHLLVRGDADHPGAEVKPGFICALPEGETDVPDAAAREKSTGRRLALADWLTEPEHPLTSRVWMNRVWRQHFGRGIVNTPSNLGLNGDLPSHPALLDWLALTFQKSGSRLKPIHRMILLSNAWQQASAIRPDMAKRDPLNKSVWRMPVRRLEAEAIRDSLLAVAGTLNPEMYGPPVYPPVDPSLRADTFQGINWPEGEDSPKTWRRSVYVKVKRSLLLPQLEVFDCPDITFTVAQRNITTTPLQALMLLNDPLILRQSALFAERLQRECGASLPAQIARAYSLCFGRGPTAKEAALSAEYVRTHSLAELCQALVNLNEFVYVQ